MDRIQEITDQAPASEAVGNRFESLVTSECLKEFLDKPKLRFNLQEIYKHYKNRDRQALGVKQFVNDELSRPL